MVFSDTTDLQGLVQHAEFELGVTISSTGDYLIKDFTRNANNWLDHASTILMRADGAWQFEDTNYTTLPIATTNIVSGQRDYTLNKYHLYIDKVLVADSTGNSHIIKQIDVHDNAARESLINDADNTGEPYRYDVFGNTILLDPVPDYNYTAGLKVYVRRSADYFDSTDTTKEPGIPLPYHRYVALGAAYDFARVKGFASTDRLRQEMLAIEEDMKSHFANRNKDRKTKFHVISRRNQAR